MRPNRAPKDEIAVADSRLARNRKARRQLADWRVGLHTHLDSNPVCPGSTPIVWTLDNRGQFPAWGSSFLKSPVENEDNGRVDPPACATARAAEARDTIEAVVTHSCRDGAGYQLRAVFLPEVLHV